MALDLLSPPAAVVWKVNYSESFENKGMIVPPLLVPNICLI